MHTVLYFVQLYLGSDPTPVYNGLSAVYEARNLEPYQMYTVTLEACTAAGCTRGDKQTFRTASISPQTQPAPVLLAVNVSHAHLEWTSPQRAYSEWLVYEILRSPQGLQNQQQASIKFHELYARCFNEEVKILLFAYYENSC